MIPNLTKKKYGIDTKLFEISPLPYEYFKCISSEPNLSLIDTKYYMSNYARIYDIDTSSRKYIINALDYIDFRGPRTESIFNSVRKIYSKDRWRNISSKYNF
jgi:hypothetical protein